MKKSLLIAFGVLVSATLVWAVAGTYNVNSVPVKSTGESVSYEEFNNLLGTIRGIFNKENADGTKSLGLNEVAPDGVGFDVNGAIQLAGDYVDADCVADFAGTVYFDNSNYHFWLCDGTNWQKLDAENCEICGPTSNDGFAYTCEASGEWSVAGAGCDISSGTPANYSSATDYVEDAVVCVLSGETPNDDQCTSNNATCSYGINYEVKLEFGSIYNYDDCGTQLSLIETCVYPEIATTHDFSPAESVPSYHPEYPRNKRADSCDATFAGTIYTCSDASGGNNWQTTGTGCATLNYDGSGLTEYFPSDSVCSSVIPDNDYCNEVCSMSDITDEGFQLHILENLSAQIGYSGPWAGVTQNMLDDVVYLHLISNNQFEIHNFAGICAMPNLEILKVSTTENSLNNSGAIPTTLPMNFTTLMIESDATSGYPGALNFIQTDLPNLTQLTTLYLYGAFTDIPSTIGGMTNLDVLSLGQSGITTLPASMSNLSLTQLFLEGNSDLASLPSGINAAQINIHNTPMDCSSILASQPGITSCID